MPQIKLWDIPMPKYERQLALPMKTKGKSENSLMPNPFIQPVTILGETVGRAPGRAFGIYRADRLSHMFILGQTGTGKSTLISNMIRQDVQKGEGFCLIDPHSDLAEAVRGILPDNAIYWDVADPDCPFGYNPLTYVAEE